ncbi:MULTISPECIES: EAL domain-containing protein [Agrobacterium]|uniref:EAL domain-containing protein n=1 Tax=Agrobacterium rosae TaxID=1972867 RepID=A0AAW9FLH9_9HYPH|nr:EAL domain-containing protein [Agrobacterium rosae]MDX8306016.1 EAL domain-containing protein [Agrobacterium rosae]
MKIDKSFVDSIGISSPKSMVIHHIIEMAKLLGARIVAEGVERSEQAEYLRVKGSNSDRGGCSVVRCQKTSLRTF